MINTVSFHWFSQTLYENVLQNVLTDHIIISKYTLECTQLIYLLKIFLEEHTLESSINKIEQRYTYAQYDQQCKGDVLQYHPIS